MPPVSKSKEYLADIVAILTTYGEKAPFPGGATEYQIGNVTLLDNDRFRIVIAPGGSVTETKGGPIYFRDQMDEVQLKAITENLKQRHHLATVTKETGHGKVKKIIRPNHFKP